MGLLEPRKTPVQARSSATVAAILEGAAQVLEAEGAGGFTTNAVAARAGVSIGTLYQYFGDKNALAAALSRKARAGLVEAVAAAVEESAALPLEAALARIVAASLHGETLRPRFAQALDALEAHLPLHGEAAAVDLALNAEIAGFLAQRFEGEEIVETADDVRAVVRALIEAAVSRGRPADGLLAAGIARSLSGMLAAMLTPKAP
jgi:AcrR family transcriptional regulator